MRRPASAASQLRRFLDAYTSGESAKTVDDYGFYPSWKPLNPDVWEIRAGETRSFGWFVRANVVVLVDGALKSELIDAAGREIDQRYQAFKRLVEDWRTARGLDSTEVSAEKDHAKLVT